MTCDSWTDAVTEAAVGGGPIAPDLLAHLEQCAACGATLENTRALLARIDGEVAAALDVEPADAWVGRVRAALAAPSTEPRWRTRLLLPAGLAAALLGSVFAWHREPSPERGVAPPIEAKAPPREIAPALASETHPAPDVPAAATPVPAHAVRVPKAPPRAPEVLVAADQAAALQALAEGSRRGRVDVSAWLEPDRVAETSALAVETWPDTVPGDTTRPLEILPLTLEPLNEEGR